MRIVHSVLEQLEETRLVKNVKKTSRKPVDTKTNDGIKRCELGKTFV